MRLIHIKLPFSTHIDEKQSLTASRLYLPKMPTKSACVFFRVFLKNDPRSQSSYLLHFWFVESKLKK